LANSIKKGLLLIAGNNLCSKNYTANQFPFRQDSNFLYFTGIDIPGLVLLIDADTGLSTLFGYEKSAEEAIWTGIQTPLQEWSQRAGIDFFKPLSNVFDSVKKSGEVHYLPSYPADRKIFLSEILGQSIKEICSKHSIPLIKAVIEQRSRKSNEEIGQIEEALNSATLKAHVEAMKMALPGNTEKQINATIESIFLQNGLSSAYATVCSVRGEILHNQIYNNTLTNNQLLLVDAGAESSMHYASDITRTTPVGGRFNNQQKAIYSIVLQTLQNSIDRICPGVPYQTIHINAAKTIVEGLKDLGLMKGNSDDAVVAGAHALFFPHGIGHMLGLDVHDMEDLGEDFVGYDQTVSRSTQFGTSFLRLARKLESGFVVTNEPGIYFIPDLIKN
jgi:Xaa-Pro aminopeptidase